MSAELQAAKASISVELESIKTTLSSEIVGLAKTLDRALRSDPSAMACASSSTASKEGDANTSGPDGHRWEHVNRGNSGAPNSDSRTHVLNSTEILVPLISLTLPVRLVLIQ
jgi:hypothetical protein